MSVAGWLLAALGLAADATLIGLHLARRPWDADFRIFYAAASVGRTRGWAQIYDQVQVRAVEAALGPPPHWAFLNPPPLAWLAAPLSVLGYRDAFAVWTALLVAALVATAWLALPAVGGPRLGWALAAAFWAFPVAFGVAEGQVTPLLMLAVVTAWRFAVAGRYGLAGVALGLTVLKPHTAWLVPVVFLVAGRPRVLLGYLAVSIPLAAVSVASLGASGLGDWVGSLKATAAGVPPPLFIFPAFLPGPWSYAAELAAVLVTLAAGYRRRFEASPALLIGIGIAGSVAAAPYLNLQDLSLLVVAGWLLWPEAATRGARALLASVYLALFITPGTTLLVLFAECIWLATTLSIPFRGSREAGTAVSQPSPSRLK